MTNIYDHNSHALQIRHANTRMLARYAHWSSHILGVTFKAGFGGQMPSEKQVHVQLRHMQCTLNTTVWKNRTRHNAKCQILFIPIVEGANTSTRIHAHVLLGNIKSTALVQEYMRGYIPRSNWLAPRYTLQEVYDADGISWYLAKETMGYNEEAIAWQLAAIPKPLLPK